MNYLDLFHGIGGFALGAYWAGMKFENHYCSDIEPWCQKLYAKRFPDSIQLGDITKIDTSKLPAGDWIITGGFPCQDISIAGKGAGIHGERSGLWFEYWRIINDLRPRFAIMENVGMLVHRGLREVLGSLAEIGYDAEWQDIRASDVGAPHRRERIWIVAHANDAGSRERMRIERERASDTENRRRFSQSESCKESKVPHPSLQLSHRAGEARRRRGEFTDGGDVANAESGESRKSPEWQRRENISGGSEKVDVDDAATTGLERQEPARGGPGESGLSTERGDELSHACGQREAERGNAGLSDITESRGLRTDNRGRAPINERGQWWSTEPAICGMVDGLPAELHGYEGRLAVKSYQRVNRLRGLGNAIVPQIAELLFRQIKPYVTVSRSDESRPSAR